MAEGGGGGGPSALVEGLNALRLAGKFTDVTLIVQGKRFKAHRVVLAACSDYFNAMFSIGMVESVKEEIHLMGVTASAMTNIIEFIYTSNLELNCDNIEEMLAASTHIQMEETVQACVKYLHKSLNLHNCLDVALLADRYAQIELKCEAYRYACAHMKKFSSKGYFMKLKLEEVFFLLSSNYPVDVTELELVKLTISWCSQDDHNIDESVIEKLFALIRFPTIPHGDLQQLHKEIHTHAIIAAIKEQRDASMKTKIPCCFSVMYSECKRQLPEFILGDWDDEHISIKGPPPSVVCNTRGMELSLLKVGGIELDGLTNSISCFSPKLNKWRKLTSIPHLDQCNYGTAVLRNNLFVIGGSYDVCLREYVHPFGFRYCPLRENWECIAPLQTERCRFSLNAIEDKLYAVGGIEDLDSESIAGWDGNSSNCECYNVVSNCWTYLPKLRENRSQHSGVAIGDKLYISGGINGSRVLSSFWCFDTNINEWQQLPSMLFPRSDHVLVEVNNKIYACGGWRENLHETREIVSDVEVYNLKTQHWSLETTNPFPTFHTGISALNDIIYFVGGLQSNDTADRATSHTFTYNVTTKEWLSHSDALNDVWELACVPIYLPNLIETKA